MVAARKRTCVVFCRLSSDVAADQTRNNRIKEVSMAGQLNVNLLGSCKLLFRWAWEF